MVINYKKFPIIKMLEQNEYNSNIKLSVFDYEEDKIKFRPLMYMLFARWGDYAKMFRKNITLLSEEYYNSMSRSWKSFKNIDLEKEIKDVSGCLIFKAKSIYVSLLYNIKDINNIQVLGLYDCDTLYIAIQGSYNNLSCMATVDDGVRYGDNDNEFALGVLNNIICYLLMEKYAKVETKECEPNSKTKDVKSKDKTINYTGLKVNIRDCTWFTTICRNEGFKVRGHFRLQPKKNEKGEWTKELIYINEFEKHGYHRQAKIETL